MTGKMTFRKKFTFEERLEQSKAIMGKYPERIPVICERFGQDMPELDRHKFLVPKDLTFGNLLFVIRKRIKLEPEKAMYLFVNSNLAPTSSTIMTLYNSHKEKDGFLYTTYAGESTFGN